MTRPHSHTRFHIPACLLSMLTFGAATLGLTTQVKGGTPLICQANDIGMAPSLPWRVGPHWNQPRSDYAPERLLPDTLAVLTATAPVIVRMETMRRATIYARSFAEKGHPRLAVEILSRLQARALEAEALGAPDALAWFDAGYFAGSIESWEATRARGEYAGYAWVRKAIGLRGGDPAMELAAAMMSLESPKKPDGHWARASAGRKTDPLLAHNLASRLSR